MAGFLDFLFGNMMSPGAAGATPGAPGAPMPQIPQMAPNVPQMNPLEGLLKSFAAPQQPQLPMANKAAVDPTALGVGSDASNPMGNESIRKMMLMQHLAKQGNSQPQQGMPAMAPSASGAMPSRFGNSMGGAGGVDPMAGARSTSMGSYLPVNPIQSRQFIGRS
jgi:hypothetical protein